MRSCFVFIMDTCWKFSIRLPFIFTLLILSSGIILVKGGGSLGCLFQTGLCQTGDEWCYDDAIFGRCLPLKSDSYDLSSTLHRNSIGELELAALEVALTQLKQKGHQWNDAVSQCVLQRLVIYFQERDLGTPDVCLELYDNEESKKGKMTFKLKEDRVILDQYQGSNHDPLQAPVYLSRNDLFNLLDIMKDDLYAVSDDQNDVKENGYLKEISPIEIPKNSAVAANPTAIGAESPDVARNIPFHLEEATEQQLTRRLQQILSSFQEAETYNEPTSSIASFDSEEDDFNLPLPSSLYTSPKFERQERLDVKKPGPWFAVNNFAFKNDGEDGDIGENTLKNIWAESNESPKVGNSEEIPTSGDLQRNLKPFDDVKIQDQNLAARQRFLEAKNEERKGQEIDFTDLTQLGSNENTQKYDYEGLEKNTGKKANIKFPFAQTISPTHELVEANYVFITTREGFQNWRQGAELVNFLSDLLKVPRDTFNDVSVQGNQVTFQVSSNHRGLNPSLVAAKADEMRPKLQELTGLNVMTTGIGDQTNVSSVLYWGQENQQMLLTTGLCLLAAAILVTATIIFLLRNRHIARQKLKDLTQSVDSEATRDYQDLCRARMAVKVSASEVQKDSTKVPHALISRDSESSRSSTSSWCEEPVVTNMDISTGHMVLSYMEDHLRNKYRLDQEWQALSSYEAEPSTSVLIASKLENSLKNRYKDVLPYDHSRVALNGLANITGSDYVNASLITDHDPRHPAYIAAQAPVAESVADFWQMIWEQGSVVLVLLTKIIENGDELCNKYWPEEGSQLYHIYEVHLVSEHIWCDDYLVRSFYLKNIRSGETRTVTQFHFQSWPENGVPSSTKALLEFRRKVNKSYRGRSCPIVVHCSDGAGRTGTYCLIDMVLHRMAKGAREIDIAATLEHLRDQRPHAVRNKQQFEFVLTAVAEEVHAILRALPQ